MMAETAVQQDTCRACGVEVREESQFCYNCGESVRGPAANEVIEAQQAPQAPGSGEGVEETRAPAASPAAGRTPLRSAASLRKQRRAYNRQPVQIAWEPREGSAGAFIMVTIALTIGAFILLVLALYLR